jgi:hypothetical protein
MDTIVRHGAVYGPLMYLDGAITGMRFHIGPHRETSQAPA